MAHRNHLLIVSLIALAASGGCMRPMMFARALQQSLPFPAQNTAGTETEDRQIAGLNVSIWKPTEISGPLPLVIFSHGFHGSSKQSTFLMVAFARHGYLVVAPNHGDSKANSSLTDAPEEAFADIKSWNTSTYKDREEDMVKLVAAMKTDPSLPAIDWSKVALAGHSLGGYTVLGMAGAWPDWRMPGIKAVLALSPYCAPLVDQHLLSNIKVPVMYQGGTLDKPITPSVEQPGGAYDQTPSPAYFVDFEGAGHLAWTNLRPSFRRNIEFYSIEFLDKYVKHARTRDFTIKRPGVDEVRVK